MTTRAIFIRRRIALGTLLLLITGLIWSGINGISSQLQAPDITEYEISGTESLNLTQPSKKVTLPESGESGIGATTFGTIALSGTNATVPIASITKTITALVVLDKLAPDPGEASLVEVTFGYVDEQIRQETIAENGASQPIHAGLSMSLHDAISIMMLASANNYATSLAIKAYGDLDSYLAAANNWLDKQGIQDLHVADASGLSPESAGTAESLLALGNLAMANETLAEIVNLDQITVDKIGTIQNGNPLHGIDGVDGIKVGSTTEAGECLLYSKLMSIDGESIRIVGVTLGQQEMSVLIDRARITLSELSNGITRATIVSRGTQFGEIRLQTGEKYTINAAEDLSAITWPGVPIIATPKIYNEILPGKGSPAGELEVTIGAETKKIPLTIN